MPREIALDKQWESLMSMCAKEKEFKTEGRHPKLLTFVTDQIDQLAQEMGFTELQIKKREFRAEKSGWHISRIIRE